MHTCLRKSIERFFIASFLASASISLIAQTAPPSTPSGTILVYALTGANSQQPTVANAGEIAVYDLTNGYTQFENPNTGRTTPPNPPTVTISFPSYFTNNQTVQNGALALSDDAYEQYLFVLQNGVYAVDTAARQYLPVTFSGACPQATSIAVFNDDANNIHQFFVVNALDDSGNCTNGSQAVQGNVVVYDITQLDQVSRASTTPVSLAGKVLSGPKQPFAAIAGIYGIYISDLDPGCANQSSSGCGKLWFLPSGDPAQAKLSMISTGAGPAPTGLALTTQSFSLASSCSGGSQNSAIDNILVFGSGSHANGIGSSTTLVTYSGGAGFCSAVTNSAAASVLPDLATTGVFSEDGDLSYLTIGDAGSPGTGSAIGGQAFGNGYAVGPPVAISENYVGPISDSSGQPPQPWVAGCCGSDLPVFEGSTAGVEPSNTFAYVLTDEAETANTVIGGSPFVATQGIAITNVSYGEGDLAFGEFKNMLQFPGTAGPGSFEITIGVNVQAIAVGHRPVCELGGSQSYYANGGINTFPSTGSSLLSFYQVGNQVALPAQCLGNLQSSGYLADIRFYDGQGNDVTGTPTSQAGMAGKFTLLNLQTPGLHDFQSGSGPLAASRNGSLLEKKVEANASSSASCPSSCSSATCSCACQAAQNQTTCSSGATPVGACAELQNNSSNVVSIFQPICVAPATVEVTVPGIIQASPGRIPVTLNASLQNVAPAPTTPSFTWTASQSNDPAINTATLIDSSGTLTPPATLSNNPASNSTNPNPTTVTVSAAWNGNGLSLTDTNFISTQFPSGSLTVITNPAVTVTITGSWFTPPLPVNFNSSGSTPPVVYNTAQLPISVTNTGNAPLTFTGLTIACAGGGSQCPFKVDSSNSCSSVQAGGNCVIPIDFTPMNTSSQAATLTIVSNSANALTQPSVQVQIQGTPSAATAGVSPSQSELHKNAPESFSVSLQGSQIPAQSPANVVWTVNGIPGGNPQLGTIVPVSPASGQVTEANYVAPATTAGVPVVNGNPTVMIGATLNNYPNVTIQAASIVIGPDVMLNLSPTSADLEVQSGLAATQTFMAKASDLISGDSGDVTWKLSGSCGGNACGSYQVNGNQLIYTAPAAGSISKPTVDTIQAISTDESSVISMPAMVEDYLAPQISAQSGTQITQTVTAGQTASYSLMLLANTGDPTKSMTVTCDPTQLPTGTTCSTAQITPGAANVPLTITITTTGEESASSSNRKLGPLAFGLILPLAGLLRLNRKTRLKRRGDLWLCLTAVLAVCLLFASGGCGTNGSFGGSAPTGIGATPNGTFTIPIGQPKTPTSAFQDIASAQLVVQ